MQRNLQTSVAILIVVNNIKIRMEPIQIHSADPGHFESIVGLLQKEKLPTQDLPDSPDMFWVAVNNELVIGAIGLEQYGNCGLLRSMVVDPAYRSKGVASRMIEKLESEAIHSGISCIYLLTETAAPYFEKKGYTKISRDNVPAEIKGSSEFSSVCPVSATVMQKPLEVL
jgi:amino-acid N-acetyltransferase